MLSATRRLTPGERAAVDLQLDSIYERFLDVVAQGRGRDRSEIEPLAGGRVWSGRDALNHGLIDRLGGFPDALAEARNRVLGPLAQGLEPELISAAHWRPKRGFLPRFIQQLALGAA